jgi:hypothetical protein
VNPVVSEVLKQLRLDAAECSQIIREVEEYDWTYGPYPVGIALPYPEEDIDKFNKRAWDALHLKTKLVTALERLGPIADRWRQQISAISVAEVYIDDPMKKGAMRPFLSGMTALREVLTTAIDLAAPVASGSSDDMPRSTGSVEAGEACRAYIIAKGFTPAQFADRCGTSDKTMRKLLRGNKVRASIFQEVAKAMGTDAEHLLRGDVRPIDLF